MTQKISTTDIIEHYLDLNQLQMAIQDEGPVEQMVTMLDSSCEDSRYIKAKHAFLISEAKQLGILPEEDIKELYNSSIEELLTAITEEIDSYGQQHAEVLSNAISDKDIDDSVTRITYKLLALAPRSYETPSLIPNKKKEDSHVDSSKDIL